MIIDIVLGCSFGHEGKGKVAYELCKNREYDLCVRFNGSEYADHTIYTMEGNKWVLQQLPVGVLIPRMYNLICSDSLINIDKLRHEIYMLEQHGIDISGRLFVSKSCSIVIDPNNTHIKRVEDTMDVFVQMGIQVVDMRYFWNMFSRISGNNSSKVLIEGSRGFEFDKNWGNQTEPSVSCTLAGAINIGINMKDIRNIYGVSSIYDIYDDNQICNVVCDDSLNVLRVIDADNTINHKRSYKYLNLDSLCHALRVNNCNVCIINRIDIIKYLGIYRLFLYDKLHIFENFEEMEMIIHNTIKRYVSPDIKIIFSYSEYVI